MSRIYELFKDLYQKVETSGMSQFEHIRMQKYVDGDLDFCTIRCDYNGTVFDIILFVSEDTVWSDVLMKNGINSTYITHGDKFSILNIDHIVINENALYRNNSPILAVTGDNRNLVSRFFKEDGSQFTYQDLDSTAQPHTIL